MFFRCTTIPCPCPTYCTRLPDAHVGQSIGATPNNVFSPAVAAIRIGRKAGTGRVDDGNGRGATDIPAPGAAPGDPACSAAVGTGAVGPAESSGAAACRCAGTR